MTNLKVIVAAVAMAAAGMANAAITLPSDASLSGSSLIFEAWDGTKSFSQVLSVGATAVTDKTFGTLVNTGSDVAFSLDPTFASGFGANAAVSWHIVSAYNAGGALDLLTTANTTAGWTQNTTAYNAMVANAATAFGLLSTNAGAASVYNAATIGDTAYAGKAAWGSNLGSTTFTVGAISGFNNGALTGNALLANGAGVASFYDVTAGATGLGAANKTLQAGQWVLASNGTLTYNVANTSVVPLPAAAWLFGSGLVGLIGIGRRRKAAVAA